MPQTPKLSPQQKVALVEKIKAGEISRQAAAQSVGVSNTTVRQWLRIYEAEGPGGLTPREKRIMELRYLRGKTQMEVAQEIGISQAQVSRLEKGALNQFRAGH